jgi:beta-aspartyl-peptidase (threonine type)
MPDASKAAYHAALEDALDAGAEVLRAGGSALDAVEDAVVSLEDSPLFNAGRGAVFDRAGGHSHDASIMDGPTLATGGVAGVATLRNPVRAARLVMERTPHALLAGQAAEEFAAAEGASVVPRNYFSVRSRFLKLQEQMRADGLTPPRAPLHGWPEPADQTSGALPKSLAGIESVGGTVGAVALDAKGGLAAATSTGGRNAKLPGRIGDSPVPGAGNFANAFVAVSGTGKGEEFLRHFAAGRVALRVEHAGDTVDEACRHVLEKVLAPGDGGLIAIGADGSVAVRTTTEAIPHAIADSTGRREWGLWLDENAGVTR